MTKFAVWTVVLVLVTPGFAAGPKANKDTLLKLEADFQQAGLERGFDGFMSYFADGAADLVNGGPAVIGKEEIRKAIGPWTPDFKLTWKPVRAEMAASGDLGYTWGNYETTFKDKDDNTVVRHGKYATIWKKQKDGSWKVAMDMGNSSEAPKKN